jgi:hypothetical protein
MQAFFSPAEEIPSEPRQTRGSLAQLAERKWFASTMRSGEPRPDPGASHARIRPRAIEWAPMGGRGGAEVHEVHIPS